MNQMSKSMDDIDQCDCKPIKSVKGERKHETAMCMKEIKETVDSMVNTAFNFFLLICIILLMSGIIVALWKIIQWIWFL